jgi:hypothetical protein
VEQWLLLAGGCHCGAVRFTVKAQSKAKIQSCNCSICRKTGFIHLIVPKPCFDLIRGDSELIVYQFNTGVAKHLFCRHCGVKSFYIPRSNPDGVSVNVNCLDSLDGTEFQLELFDGQNWEANAAALSHLSK